MEREQQKPPRLILVIEITCALEQMWPVLMQRYIEEIVKAFYTFPFIPAATRRGMAIISYESHSYETGYLIHRSGWKWDIDEFLNALSSLTFTPGDFDNPVIAQALAAAFLMFDSNPDVSSEGECRNHCLLIAASESDQNATTVAHAFQSSGISVSVLASTQLPQLVEIFMEANAGLPSDGSPIDTYKPHLLLLSDNFLDELTRTLLHSRIGNQE